MVNKLSYNFVLLGIFLSLNAMEQTPHSTNSVFWGFADRIGKRTTMEDTHVAITPLISNTSHSLFGIFDGHGGVAVADYVKKSLPENLAQHISQDTSGSGIITHAQLLRKAFVETDNQLREKNNRSIYKYLKTGSTAVVAWVVNNCTVNVGWLGDSRAVLVDKHGNVAWASIDHKPNEPAERNRIESQNGFIKLVKNTWRLGKVGQPANLSVARAFGDIEYKNGEGNNQVSNTPDMTTLGITKDHFLILACDGVWDVLSNEEAANIAHKIITAGVQKEPIKLNEQYQIDGNSQLLQLAAQEIRDKAFEKGSYDNISVMILQLPSSITTSQEKKSQTDLISAKSKLHSMISANVATLGLIATGAIIFTLGAIAYMRLHKK